MGGRLHSAKFALYLRLKIQCAVLCFQKKKAICVSNVKEESKYTHKTSKGARFKRIRIVYLRCLNISRLRRLSFELEVDGKRRKRARLLPARCRKAIWGSD